MKSIRTLLLLSVLLCLMAVQGFTAPTTAFVSSGGTGNSGQFRFIATDTLGATDIQYTQVDFRDANGNSGCVLQMNSANNTTSNMGMGLRLGDGYTWQWALIGEPQVSSNDHCTLQRSTSTWSQSGNNRAMDFTLIFSFNFPGPKTVWGVTGSLTQGNSGWQQIGTWTVAGAPPPPPSTVMVNNGGSGSEGMLTFQVTDALGAADIDFTNISVGSVAGGPDSCTLQLHWGYTALQNDAANGWSWGIVGLDPPSSNSHCTHTRTTTTWSNNGNVRNMSFALSFTPSFAGTKTVWSMSGGSMGYTNWTPTGVWTIPVTYEKEYSASYDAKAIPQGLGPDPFTGTQQPILTVDQTPPQTFLMGDPYTVTFGSQQILMVKFAKPNTQVWARNFQSNPISHEPDGSVRYIYNKPAPNGPTPPFYSTTAAFEVFYGGWLLGTTDSNGYFQFPFEVGSGGGSNTTHIYVGNHSGTYLTSLPDVEFVGTANFWNQDSTGNPTAPARP